MKHEFRHTTDTPTLCDKNDLEYYIDKYQDMESCYRSVATKCTKDVLQSLVIFMSARLRDEKTKLLFQRLLREAEDGDGPRRLDGRRRGGPAGHVPEGGRALQVQNHVRQERHLRHRPHRPR